MRYTVHTSVVDVIGYLWMPNTEAAQRYTLSDYDMGAVTDVDGNVTRDSLRSWVDTNTGDFANVVDFSASLEVGDRTVEIPWADEDSELTFNGCMWPEDDDDSGITRYADSTLALTREDK